MATSGYKSPREAIRIIFVKESLGQRLASTPGHLGSSSFLIPLFFAS